MGKIAGAFGSWEVIEEATDGGPERLDSSFGGFAQKRLELGEELLDRIEIGRVGRQVDEGEAVAGTPAVMNAILDAVARLGVRDLPMPAAPERIWRALRERAPR